MSDLDNYYGGGLHSQGHTPIYKMHKYFARRPHNIFLSLISHYTKPGDIIFDPFGGGGVTLIEGLTSNRRIISSDVNPIASFVQYSQASDVSEENFLAVANKILSEVRNIFSHSLTTSCTDCNEQAHVRWFEHSYIIDCPHCHVEVDLSNANLSKNLEGKPKPGQYTCSNCTESFKSANVKRKGSRLMNIKFKCGCCGTHKTKYPDNIDLIKFKYFTDNEISIISDLNLLIPTDEIPHYWDRQQEDCLHRKGILKFTDLFTKRNLLISAYFFSCLERLKQDIDNDLYLFTLFTISSMLRYTNNMTFSTSSWMDGRPVAWAKHAYWLPNQFIEVNPLEYFELRVKACLQGINDRNKRYSSKQSSKNESDFFSENADYCVVSKDSTLVNIPPNSIDAVITDPPYGSNVQYSELCAFWYVWLKDKIPFQSETFFFPSEAVVHRKTKDQDYNKSFAFYTDKLRDIFSKCYDLLKPGGFLIFTFNNKNIKAWFAVLKAAIDAGFYLDTEGIVYQEPIEAYKDTAHQRFDGTPQGDYIYSFKKTGYKIDFSKVPITFEACFEFTINMYVERGIDFGILEFLIAFYVQSTFSFIYRLSNGEDETSLISEISLQSVEKKLNSDSRLSFTENHWVIVK